MAKCVPCMGPEIKDAIRKNINSPEVEKILGGVKDCATPQGLELCGTVRRKSSRAPSAYNVFIGDCMRGKGIKSREEAPTAMKECAAEWRKSKV